MGAEGSKKEQLKHIPTSPWAQPAHASCAATLVVVAGVCIVCVGGWQGLEAYGATRGPVKRRRSAIQAPHILLRSYCLSARPLRRPLNLTTLPHTQYSPSQASPLHYDQDALPGLLALPCCFVPQKFQKPPHPPQASSRLSYSRAPSHSYTPTTPLYRALGASHPAQPGRPAPSPSRPRPPPPARATPSSPPPTPSKCRCAAYASRTRPCIAASPKPFRQNGKRSCPSS